MIDSTKPIDDATHLDDVSGLKLPKDRSYSLKEVYEKEAQNIAKATIKYLSAPPSKKEAPFTYSWMMDLHEEMFGDVWNRAGKLRKKTTEETICHQEHFQTWIRVAQKRISQYQNQKEGIFLVA